jgi:predicted Abi (CAAX) family protease
MICGILCVVFLLFALLFTILKEKGAMLVSGFNTIPKEEKALYDTAKLSSDQRNAFLIWAIILGVGSVLAYCITQYIAIISVLVWLVVFFKDIHLDSEKAFGKYKMK